MAQSRSHCVRFVGHAAAQASPAHTDLPLPYPQRDRELPQLKASPDDIRQRFPLSSNSPVKLQLLAGTQRPSMHASPAAQARPHAPQFAASLRRSVQLVPQVVNGSGQTVAVTHAPL